MTFAILFLVLAAVFGVYWTIKTKKIFPGIITAGLVVSTAMILFPEKVLQTPGFSIYLGFIALAFIYGLTIKGKDLKARIIICLMAASIFAYWIWVHNHWHGNTVLLPILTLMTAAVGIVSKAKLRNELGFLTILAVDAIAILIENWVKMN